MKFNLCNLYWVQMVLQHNIAIFFLLLKSFFSPDVAQNTLIIRLEKYNIKIYFPQELSSLAQIFASEIYEQNKVVKDIVGVDARDFSIYLGFESDSFYFERFFTHSKLIFVNWGGTRIDEKLSGLSISHKVRQVLLAALFGTKNFYIIRPDLFTSPELISAFAEFGEIEDSVFLNYPFSIFYSDDSKLIKYIELFYGKREVFELFINGKIFFESKSKYYKPFKSWEKSRLEALKEFISSNYEGINLYPEKVFDFPARGIHFIGEELFTTKEKGWIFSSKSGNIFQRKGGRYLNGDGKFLVFDSKSKEDNLFEVFIMTPSYEIFKLPQKRAWYPDIFSREDGTGFVLFIRKNLLYDELCILNFAFVNQKFQFDNVFCPLRSGELEEFFTPDISPDGKKIVFSYLRKNGFLDVAVFDIENNSFRFITQDIQPDIFPSFTQDGKILFTSFKEGRFLLYIYDNGNFFKVSENPEGILEGKVYNGKVYSTFVQEGKTYLGVHQIAELGSVNFQRERISFVGTDFESSRVKLFDNMSIFRLLPPRIFVDSSGFFGLALYFLLADDIYRSPIFLSLNFSSNINFYEQAENMKFIKTLNSNLPKISNLDSLKSESFLRGFGFSFFSFLRAFYPYIFLRFSLYPFSGIFVRQVFEGNENRFFFIPERQISQELYFFQKGIFQKGSGKLWLIFGGKFGEISPYEGSIPTFDTSFWNFIREEYKRVGYGKFFQVESGIYFTNTYKTFSPHNGFDIRIFLGAQSFIDRDKLPISPYSTFSFSYFTPSVHSLLGYINLNGFLSFPYHKRFRIFFGSKSIPFYFEPADNFSSLWKFGTLPFFPENLKYDVGLIRGVRLREGNIGGVIKTGPIFKLFSSSHSPKYIYHIDFVNLSPFFSLGFLQDSKQNFISYGLELKIKSKFFFIVPSDMIFGFAKGEVSEFYFLVFISP